VKQILDPSNARSRHTRTALLASARSLLERDGFEALTMAAVADRAGVTRRAVYLHFASRSELVADLFDFVSEAEGLAASTGAVWASTDADAALEEWAAHLARFHPRVLAISRAAERLRGSDPDAAQHRERYLSDRSLPAAGSPPGSSGRVGSLPGGRPKPRPTCCSASSQPTCLSASSMRGWPHRCLARHLALLLRSTFLSQETRNNR